VSETGDVVLVVDGAVVDDEVDVLLLHPTADRARATIVAPTTTRRLVMA
jgi:hypothetical protein